MKSLPNLFQNNIIFKICLSILLLFCVITAFLDADSDGRANRTSTTSTGCGCHGGSRSTAVTLSATSGSGSFTVGTGSTTAFTVKVQNIASISAGVNIAVKSDANTDPGMNEGNLIPGTSLTYNGAPQELTHSAPVMMNNNEANFTFQWSAPFTPGTYYLRAIGLAGNNMGDVSGDLWNWMDVQVITVIELGTISLNSPNGSENWCGGTANDITWVANGVARVRIDLSTDGGTNFNINLARNIDATFGSWTWSIPDTLSTSTTFKIKITDESNSSINDASVANFSITRPPRITLQPLPLTLCPGDNAIFTANAAGSNLSFQWRKNGSNIQNATLQSYRIDNILESDSGYYDVRVTGTCGNVTSIQAFLGIKPPPKIVIQPKSDTVCTGQPAKIEVTATGTALNYSWIKNGITIPSSNMPYIEFQTAQTSDAGKYVVVVSGACLPKVTSDTVNLVVYQFPGITEQPKAQSVKVGEKVEFSVKAVGTNIKYQWRKNGIDIVGAISDKLIISSAVLSDSGLYNCRVYNMCNSLTSQSAMLNIDGSSINLIVVNSGDIDMGFIMIGSLKVSSLTNFMKNTGNREFTLNHIGDANVDSIYRSFILMPNESKDISITTAPLNKFDTLRKIIYSYKDENNVEKFTKEVRVRVIPGYVEFISEDIDFGKVLVGAMVNKSATIRNMGNADAQITRYQYDNSDSVNFKFTPTFPKILSSMSVMNLDISFKPDNSGIYETNLLIYSDNSSNPIIIRLMGEGIASDVSNEFVKDMMIYPNPANEKIYINLPDINGIIDLKILDRFGQNIYSFTPVTDFENKYIWDGTDNNGYHIPSGIYYLLIKTINTNILHPIYLIK